MKALKKIIVLFIILIGIFSFSKKEHVKIKSSLNLEKIDVINLLSNSQFECRPSSELSFYIETKLIKKSRGYNTIDTSVFVLDLISDEYNLLAKEEIIVPFHKDSFINYESKDNIVIAATLINGDKVLRSDSKTAYSLSQLLKYDVIYSRYLGSVNRLLKS